MRTCCPLKHWALSLGMAGLGMIEASVHAQETLRWLEYTNVWRYDQSGADLGAAWREPGFDDSAWPAGAGLLGWETSMPQPYPVPFNTVLGLGTPQVITYYFRTAFELSQVPESLAQLKATVYADDGCVVYLNGVEAGRIRVPAGQSFQTTGSGGGAAYEGAGESLVIPLNALRVGGNVLAAEVHQASATSSDVVWGMKLRAILATPIVITRQPESQEMLVGQTNTLSVEITGGPADYQWFKDGANLPGATNRTLTLTGGDTNVTGRYLVTASNYFGVRVSESAMLTVLPPPPTGALDFTGPRLVGAVERIIAGPSSTNTLLDVLFSEAISSAGVTTTSCVVRSLVDGSDVPVASAISASRTIRLRLAGANWRMDGNLRYEVIANGIRDTSPNRNVVPPNSRIPVSMTGRIELVSTNGWWDYHAFVLADPTVLEGKWYAPDFALSPAWGANQAPFYTPATAVNCAGPGLTSIPFQYHPLLFRTTFEVTNEMTDSATLVLSGVAPLGMAVYLNGEEIYREGVPAAPAELTVDTRAMANVFGLVCGDRSIPNVRLRRGTNLLACSGYQYRDGQTFTSTQIAAFAMAVRADYVFTPRMPEPPSPVLDAETVGSSALRFSWTGSGFALESTTNVGLGSASYPYGPWIEVTNMSNPYTNPLTGPGRFFRLKQ